MGARAKSRQVCTLQPAHADGACAFVRLTDPAAELPAMFEGRQAELVAHNAQFETEVLLKHGVAAHIECTMLAAKALYLTAGAARGAPAGRLQPSGAGRARLGQNARQDHSRSGVIPKPSTPRRSSTAWPTSAIASSCGMCTRRG